MPDSHDESARPRGSNHVRSPLSVPPGSPKWITLEVIKRTIDVWQPYYREALTADDAVAMIRNVTQLFRVLARGASP
jgi:hypothetical protein